MTQPARKVVDIFAMHADQVSPDARFVLESLLGVHDYLGMQSTKMGVGSLYETKFAPDNTVLFEADHGAGVTAQIKAKARFTRSAGGTRQLHLDFPDAGSALLEEGANHTPALKTIWQTMLSKDTTANARFVEDRLDMLSRYLDNLCRQSGYQSQYAVKYDHGMVTMEGAHGNQNYSQNTAKARIGRNAQGQIEFDLVFPNNLGTLKIGEKADMGLAFESLQKMVAIDVHANATLDEAALKPLRGATRDWSWRDMFKAGPSAFRAA